jgi:2,3-bisphosphoglycerate-independent phosphoglycerate mutase
VDKTFDGSLKDGKLADLAPTILGLMNIPIPEEMTGENLLQK